MICGFIRFTNDAPMEQICMNKNELASFLTDNPKDVEVLIKQFEMNPDLQAKGFLSLDG